MKKIALLTLLLINLSLSFSLPRNQASPAIFSVTKTNNSILFRHTDSTLTAIPCQSVASIVSNADPSKIVSVWVVQQGDYDKIMQFDYLVCGFSSKSDAVDSLTAWATCDTSGGAYTTILYTNTDSATITSYDVLNSQNAPPGSPATGDIYLVGNSPSGAWVGHAKDIAEWDGADWVFTDGVQGDFLYNATNALTYIFRSGNWVQTTGIPALNNGNTISSGLRIGTNNARSLTFETNNVNRGRFDSVGRFYIYDTSLHKANKYLQIDSITGRLVASEISGSSGGGSLSSLTAATASNTIDNAANVQEWQWNSLTSGSGFILKSNNSGLAGATSSVLEVNSTGSSAINNTTNALKLVNNRSGAGVNVGADITVGGTVGTIGLNITNATTWGRGINLTSGMSQGIQMNNNMLAFSTTPHSIQYNGSYFHINSASSQTFFTATGTSNYWAFCTSAASNFFTINRVANGSYALIFGGDYPGAYRSELTSNNVIKASNGTITICGNTGLAGGFGSFTPTEILTVYGTNTNVGIGTSTPVASAKLQISSTTSGFLPPVMTSTQASAISSPAQGLMLFVTDTNGTFTSVGWWGYNGATWEKLNN